MGNWGTGILQNDISNGIYSDFMEMYASDMDTSEIKEKLINENQDELNDPFSTTDFWVGLSLALWETKALDNLTFQKVKQIIESGLDLTNWKELGASQRDIQKREKDLSKFLLQISVERKRAKSRDSIKLNPIFQKGDCLIFKLENGNYGGAIVLEADTSSNFGFGRNLVCTTRINRESIPTLDDFAENEVLYISYDDKVIEKARIQIVWFLPDLYKRRYSEIYTKVGQITIQKNFVYDGTNFYGSAGWHLIKEDADKQFQFEQTHPKPNKTIKVKEIIE